MGVYVYKVTGAEAHLANGETANVAVFAYKPSMSGDDHARSGAQRCDDLAKEGKRHPWVVLGSARKGGRTASVELCATAVKLPNPVGSLSDGAFDSHIEKGAETSTVIKAGRFCRIKGQGDERDRRLG
jgi:hypothetical protein